jgi:D-aspartate ligase
MIEIRDTSVPVVILQFAPWLHHGGLGVARTVGRLGVRVFWVHGQFRAPVAALSRYVHERVLCDANSPPEASVECLLEWGRQIGRKSVLIPVDDVATIFIADQAEALKECFLFPEQPVGLARSLSSKKDMHSLCRQMNVPTHKVTFPQSADDVATFVETAVFPIVMKRIAGWLLEQTRMESMNIVNSPEVLFEEYKRTERPGEQNVMLQEYIPGTLDSLWVFHESLRMTRRFPRQEDPADASVQGHDNVRHLSQERDARRDGNRFYAKSRL